MTFLNYVLNYISVINYWKAIFGEINKYNNNNRSDISSQDECAESLDVPPLSQIRSRDANHITAGVYTEIERPVR